jgi:hypothetical protein
MYVQNPGVLASQAREYWKQTRIAAQLQAKAPMRRVLGVPWFQPLARVGADSGGELVLSRHIPPLTQATSLYSMEYHMVAPRNGELFLYMNDALFVFDPRLFYRSNDGIADVMIELDFPHAVRRVGTH